MFDGVPESLELTLAISSVYAFLDIMRALIRFERNHILERIMTYLEVLEEAFGGLKSLE